MQNAIEKSFVVTAAIARVWRALADHQEFGSWFRVKLDSPFVVGEETTGRVTLPDFEHMLWKSTTTALETERLLAFTWNPYDYEPYVEDPQCDAATAPLMLVEFRLKSAEGGTLIVISESGFALLPDDARREEMLHRNIAGWNEQVANLKAYVEA